MDKILKQTFNGKIQNKILCVGKNYFDHIKEMGGTQQLNDPVIFQKPFSSLFFPQQNKNWTLPYHNNEIHHEIELAFIIQKTGKFIKQQDYQEYIGGYFLAIDFTDRDLQGKYKQNRLPWDLSKGQDNFCVLSEFIEKQKIQDPHNIDISLYRNDKIVQNGNTSQMIHSIPKILEYVSKYMTINEGDIFLMGTPSGVGPILQGDYIRAEMKFNSNIISEFQFNVQKPNL